MAEEWCLMGEQIPCASKPLGNDRKDCDQVSLHRLPADRWVLTNAEQEMFV